MPHFDVTDMQDAVKDPRYIPAIELLRRNGAKEVQLRYDEEQQPLVWVAVAGFSLINGKPAGRGKLNAWQAGGGLDPLSSLFALCRACLDRKGWCTHCHRNTMFEETIESQPLEDFYCWYQWDPENRTFRRGCEGD